MSGRLPHRPQERTEAISGIVIASCAVWQKQAQDDLLEIGDGIAEYDPERALEVLDGLEEQCQALAALPMMGREREAVAPRLRSLPCPPYIIFYYALENGVDIARILHSSRDVESMF